MVYKQILVPDKENNSIEIPEEFFGKEVVVTIVELNQEGKHTLNAPPPGKKISVNELFEHFGQAPDFPSTDEIRAKAWPSKW